MSHKMLAVTVLFTTVSPFSVHAGVFSSFGEKIKTIFVGEKEEDNEIIATTQTMNLIKPVVVGDEEVSQSEDIDALMVSSGPMRLSTEEVDFPETDQISVYEVKKGDTLTTVASLFGVSVNTIVWANNLTSRTISKGDTLIILPVTGIKHTVKKGDTVNSLAKKYKADTLDITSYNGITEETVLAVGDVILVPDGEIQIAQPAKPKTVAAKKPKILDSFTRSAPGDFFVRPLVGGRKTQGIHGHNAVDIAATPGTPVIAAAGGKAIVAKMGGYNGGYGNMIIISHESGIQTVYAHLKDIYITQGQILTQGQIIGEVGNSGRSTGPHLHFEVRGAKNPF